MHDTGISASHSTIQKKRKILVKQHLERKIATAQAYTEQRKLILLEAVIDSDSERNEEILPCVINVLLTGCFIKSIFLLLYSGSRKKIADPVTSTSSQFGRDGPASYIPIQRIFGKCDWTIKKLGVQKFISGPKRDHYSNHYFENESLILR